MDSLKSPDPKRSGNGKKRVGLTSLHYCFGANTRGWGSNAWGEMGARKGGGACHRGCCADDPSDDQKGALKGTSERKHVWTG
ncbi:hypothetical protein CEXT_664671 [Caerostris extrusa]|uniref:Uncharacterized protein n=1 Tax=Caerostris extrusa TaxID=172846 RepID=A0AAV4PVD1_CAEEX|nr:hypothetical protein CEXT_664671 [Caerostris extrusa]